MVKPAFVKLGGSVITDKSREGVLRKAQARRLLLEIRKSEVPVVLFHGAGGFGHPQAKRAGIGAKNLPNAAPISDTLAGTVHLHGEVVAMAAKAGLQPFPVPLHLALKSESGELVGMPSRTIQRLVDEGCTPVVGGTVVQDDELGWRIASADELMEVLTHDLEPRLALFVTDVDGVYENGPKDKHILPRVTPEMALAADALVHADVTGGMAGKLRRAFTIAAHCPVLIANGTVRGRVLDILKGKDSPSTRIETS